MERVGKSEFGDESFLTAAFTGASKTTAEPLDI